jgi:hypothetical protein
VLGEGGWVRVGNWIGFGFGVGIGLELVLVLVLDWISVLISILRFDFGIDFSYFLGFY